MAQALHEGPENGTSATSMSAADLNRELRTFLHTIIGYIELLQEDVANQAQHNLAPELEKMLLASNQLAALVEENSPDTPVAHADKDLEPTSLSRENAGKWLRDRIFSPSQQQFD